MNIISSLEMEDKKYYYISLKWTHKDDQVFTLWCNNSIGYTYDKNYIGSYSEEINNDSLRSVLIKDVEELFEYRLIGDQVCKVLLNTKENRKVLGVRKKDLNKLYVSGYGSLVYKDAYGDIDKVHRIIACTNGEVKVYDSAYNSLLDIEKELFIKHRDRALYKKISDVAESFFIGKYQGDINVLKLSREEFKNLFNLW